MTKEEMRKKMVELYELEEEYLKDIPDSVYQAMNDKIKEYESTDAIHNKVYADEMFKIAYESQQKEIQSIYQLNKMMKTIQDFKETTMESQHDLNGKYSRLKVETLDLMATVDYIKYDITNKDVLTLIDDKIPFMEDKISEAYLDRLDDTYNRYDKGDINKQIQKMNDRMEGNILKETDMDYQADLSIY